MHSHVIRIGTVGTACAMALVLCAALVEAKQGRAANAHPQGAAALTTAMNPPAGQAPAGPQEMVDAVAGGNLARVKELAERDPQLLKARTPRSSTLLHVGASIDHEEISRYLIEKGADINAVRDGDDFYTPLMAAGIKVTRLLLERGADIDYKTPGGVSAITRALEGGDREVFDSLLDRKAKLELPDLRTYRGLRCVESAMRMGHVGLLAILAGQGLNPRFENNAGMTLVHFAAESGSTELIHKLAAFGAPLNERDIYGWTPLHRAAHEGNRPVVELLIQKGLDKNARTIDGKTPYLFARDEKKTDVADYLAGLGADQGAPNLPVLSGRYFGQKPPGRIPQPFVVGIPDIERGLHGIFSFSPDGKEAYWKPVWSPFTPIYVSRMMANGRWTTPAIAPFSAANQGDDVPFISPDGSRLLFLSQRPLVDGKLAFPYVEKIWVMDRTPGGWSEPRKLPETVNAVGRMHWQLSVDNAHTLYFGAGGSIYRVPFKDGEYLQPERLGTAVNANRSSGFSPFTSPDGRYLIFSRQLPGFLYQLFISFRKPDGTWGEASNLSDHLGHEYSLNARLSPDGKYLFFSGRSGVTYWVDAAVIDELTPKR